MGGWRTLCKGRISSNSLIVVKVREKKVVERERNNNDRWRRVFEALSTVLSASSLFIDHMGGKLFFMVSNLCTILPAARISTITINMLN